MSAVKIGASRQVIIPKKVYEMLGLSSGDYLDVTVKDGSLLMSPKTLVDKPRRAQDVGAEEDDMQVDTKGETSCVD